MLYSIFLSNYFCDLRCLEAELNQCIHSFNFNVCVQSLTHVQIFVILWITACQAPLSVGFCWQEWLEWVATSFSRRTPQARESNPCILHLLYWQADYLPLSHLIQFTNCTLENVYKVKPLKITLILINICIYLLTGDFEHFCYVYLPFVWWCHTITPSWRYNHWPRARHPGMRSQVGLRKHHYEQS